MSISSRYRRERPWAAQLIDTHEAIRKLGNDNPDMDPSSALPAAHFSIAFAILDLSDAIREHGKAQR